MPWQRGQIGIREFVQRWAVASLDRVNTSPRELKGSRIENEHLRHISLSDNPLCGDDASWDALCNAVKASSSLEELALSGIGLDKKDSQDRWRLKNKMESATVANSVREGVKLELS